MFKVVGIVDEVTTCECCGKSDLKKTVALMDEEGNVQYFGTICAGKKLGYKKEVAKKVEKDLLSYVASVRNDINKFILDSMEYGCIYRWNLQLKQNPNVDTLKALRKIEEFKAALNNKVNEVYGELIKKLNIKRYDLVRI
jgi:hypothetical protein